MNKLTEYFDRVVHYFTARRLQLFFKYNPKDSWWKRFTHTLFGEGLILFIPGAVHWLTNLAWFVSKIEQESNQGIQQPYSGQSLHLLAVCKIQLLLSYISLQPIAGQELMTPSTTKMARQTTVFHLDCKNARTMMSFVLAKQHPTLSTSSTLQSTPNPKKRPRKNGLQSERLKQKGNESQQKPGRKQRPRKARNRVSALRTIYFNIIMIQWLGYVLRYYNIV